MVEVNIPLHKNPEEPHILWQVFVEELYAYLVVFSFMKT